MAHRSICSISTCKRSIARTGKIAGVYETGGRIFASPIIEAESLWISSNDGRLHEVDRETGKLKSFFQTTERIVNSIASQNDVLYVPTVANEIYCIKRKSKDGKKSEPEPLA
jgi:outer membrane protein assembly factor BamB